MTQSSANNGVGGDGGLPIGSKLGKYELLERVGAGGESIVYRAHDPFLDRFVAIKQIAPHLAKDETYRERFREIARRLARLRCEEVIVIHELIEDERGVFVVMEYVEGHTIASTLANQSDPVEPKAVLQILWRVAAGLAEVHRAGIVHRDIKPGNIIIGQGLRVKITDFGVAAPAGVPASVRYGTARYMAPDLMSASQVDARADIYSLGVVAYEMLLGRAKFNETFADVVRDTSPQVERDRWMKWHLDPDKIAPPLHEINPGVPEALSRIVGKMLAKDPEDRFRNVEELGREIRASFSPRAQKRAPRGDRKHRVSLDVAADAEAVSMAAGLGDDALAAGPEPTEEPHTAEIPKSPMSLKKKLIYAGVLAAGLLVALIANAVVDASKRSELTIKAMVAYSKAERIYRNAGTARSIADQKSLYESALAEYRKVMDNDSPFKALPLAAQARTRGWMCHSYLYMLKADFTGSDGQLEKAKHELDRFARAGGDQEWIRGIRREIEDFRGTWRNHKRYSESMAKAESLVREGKLDDALVVLGRDMRGDLSVEQRARVTAVKIEIETEKKKVEYRRLIAEGEAHDKDGDVNAAVVAYDQAVAVLDPETLDAKTYNDLKVGAVNRKAVLLARTDYIKAVREASKLSKRDRLGAAAAYHKAVAVFDKAATAIPAEARKLLLAIAKPDELKDKAIDLEHDHWLQQGKQHLAANRIGDAERDLKKARALKDSPAVQRELAKIQKQRDYESLVRAGDKLYRQRNYGGALEQYETAIKFATGSRAAVQGKINDCKYFIEFANAQGYEAKGEWDRAQRSLMTAKRIKPANSAQIDAMLEQLQRKRAYAQAMAQADRAFKTQDWPEALQKLADAKKVRPTSQEVDLKIKDVRYEQYFQMALAAIDEGDLRAALSYFNLAKNAKSTAELDLRIKQVEQALKATEGKG